MTTQAEATRNLIAALTTLKPSGTDGFEGLVCNLLSKLIGHEFRLAKSGFQAGRDMSTGRSANVIVAVECKRFRSTTDFDDSQLLGKLAEAHQDLAPDVWALASSRRVGDVTVSKLQREAEQKGIELLILDCSEEGGPLLALCAQYPKIVESAFGSTMPSSLQESLREIRGSLNHDTLIAELTCSLSQASIGYSKSSALLLKRFLDSQEEETHSALYFGQRLLPRLPGNWSIDRAEPLAAMNAWWEDSRDRRSVLVLEGMEGTGKTWALASWLTSKLVSASDPPVLLWRTAQGFGFEDLEDLAVSALRETFSEKTDVFLKRRFRAWTIERAPCPRVIMVLDGINERPQIGEWKRWLLSSSRIAARLPGLSVILTARSDFLRKVEWARETQLQPERGGALAIEQLPPLRKVQVCDFSDEELQSALDKAGLKLNRLTPDLERLLRHPRYFGVAVGHWPDLLASGDFTRERLFFEELKERASGRLRIHLSDGSFANLLIEAARASRIPSQRTLSPSELSHLVGNSGDWHDRIEALVSDGIFDEVEGAPGRLRLSKDRLYVGLGLYLLQEASLAAPRGLEAAIEVVEAELERLEGADDVSHIVSNAVCAALLSSGRMAAPIEARVAVLLALAKRRNGADYWLKTAPWQYFTDNPTVFAESARIEWSSRLLSSEARGRLAHCYACVAERRPVVPEIIAQVASWLGSAHPSGGRPPGASDRSSLPEHLHRYRSNLLDGTKAIETLHLPIQLVEVQADPLALADLSFLVISHGPIEAYAPAITAWALSRAVMGVAWESSDIAWLLRFAPGPVVQNLRSVAGELIDLASATAIRAAANLLWACGAPSDVEQARRLAPSRPRPDAGPFKNLQTALAAFASGVVPEILAKRLERLALDFEVDLADLATCNIQRILENLEPKNLSGRMRTIDSGTFESAEAALSRIDPVALATFFRSAVRAQVGNLAELSTSLYLLEQGFLILESDDLGEMRELQSRLEETPRPSSNDPEHELAAVLLACLESAEDQLNFLLSRRSSFDNRDWAGIIGDLPPEAARRAVNHLATSAGVARRRLLWFGWQEPIALDDEDRKVIRAAASDREVGTVAVLPSQHARDPELLLQAIEDRHFDDELLSRLFMRGSWEHEALKANSQRVEGLLGVAARSWLATSSDGARAWAQTVDVELRTSPSNWAMGPDGHYSRRTLQMILDAESSIADCWIDSVLRGAPLGIELSQRRPGLLESLAIELLTRNDARGVELVKTLLSPSALMIRQVDGKSQVPITTFWPFEAADTAATRTLIRWLIEQAVTNDELQQLAYAAQLFDGATVLHEVAWQAAEFSEFGRARALTLDALGVSESKALDAIDHHIATESTWVVWAAEHARIELRRELQARHWFREFLSASGREASWAAFRLFLSCVDRRFWLWKHEELEDAKSLPDFLMRSRHLALNRHELERRIENRTKENKGRLFAWTVPSTDMLPWKRSWSLS